MLAAGWLAPALVYCRQPSCPCEQRMHTSVAEQKARKSEGETAPSQTERVKLLLIEDNPSDARLIEVMLEHASDGLFDIEHVERLSAGIQRLKQGGINVVLSDLSLPDSDGLDTFAR